MGCGSIACHDDHILSVSAVTTAIKGTLEGAFPFVWVRGQVTNLSRPSSGHVYFSLRDEESSLAAVWFKGNQKVGERFDPLTGEVYEDGPKPSLAHSLENGREMVCAGRITVYGARGVYQLVVELAQEAGLGRLHEEFERLRNRLAELGYFASERKRPLPAHPARVAVITAPTGAAVHDFLKVGKSRGLAATIRLYPAPMQGDGAAPAIIAAMRRVACEGWAEVIVLIRGGGSIEDLWAFNDPELARAVFESPLPVLAGIGHEVDYTLVDLTADLRAATPTHAAHLLWRGRAELAARLRTLAEGLELAGDRSFGRREELLAGMNRVLRWQSPSRRLTGMREQLDAGRRLLAGAGRLWLEQGRGRLAALVSRLENRPGGLPAMSAQFLEYATRLARAGSVGQSARQKRLLDLESALARAPDPLLDKAAHRLELCRVRLEALNPHAPLSRGYAMAIREDGTFVRRRQDVAPGEALRLVVSDGDIPVRVEENTDDTP